MLDTPPPFGLRIWLLKLPLALALSCATSLAARPAGDLNLPSAQPSRPSNFPNIDTLVERTNRLLSGEDRDESGLENVPIEGVAFPTLERGTPRPVRHFHHSALRAVRQTYQHDHDDPAVLLSLQAKLKREASLESVRMGWSNILEQAVRRAQTLEAIRFPLQRLRQAFEVAYFDDHYGVYRNLDIPKCLRASRRAASHLSDEGGLKITVGALGSFPIETIHTLCEQALQLELAARTFPEELGSGSTRAEVAKAYRRFAPSEQVLKISAPNNDGNPGEQLASIGVELPSDKDGFRCALLEVSLSRDHTSTEDGALRCCTVRKTIPINCKELRQ